MNNGNCLVEHAELGQVWTPSDLAESMVINAFNACGHISPEVVIDPACGPATFEIAMHRTGCFPKQILAIDCDGDLVEHTEKVVRRYQLPARVLRSDYLLMPRLKGTADIVIMNPPYIRHENLPTRVKEHVFNYLSKELDCFFDRRSNLYCYFLLKAVLDLKVGGILCAIVYDSLNNTLYGKRILEFLEENTDILSSEHVLTPFHNVLVDARILTCKKRLDRKSKVADGNESVYKTGHARLSDLLMMQRGTAIPFRKVFMANPEDPYFDLARPFFAKQNKIEGLLLKEAPERCYIINDRVNPSVKRWVRKRLKSFGRDADAIEVRPVRGKILFNYYIRNNPRHLFNPKQIPVSDNFYVSEPIDKFPAEAAWLLLNSDGYVKPIIDAGRSQGNGLTKLQLFEYKNSIVPDWRLLKPTTVGSIQTMAEKILKATVGYHAVHESANKVFSDLEKYFSKG